MKVTMGQWTALLAILLLSAGTYLLGNSLPKPVLYLSVLLTSILVTWLFLVKLIPRLQTAGITGKDENKPGNPEIPEMGGLAVIAGFTAGALLSILLFFQAPSALIELVPLLAAIITIHSIAFMGVVDDLISIPQWLKAILPLFAAVPLIVINVSGVTSVTIPLIGPVDFGILYIWVLVPVAVAVCSNLTNMLAGFNGMEAGMGAIIFAALALLAFSHGSPDMLLICIPMLGGLLGFLVFNWYPAKVFPGDVMNLTIGVAVATAVIIGHFQSAGVILMAPYILDFAIKVANRFPHTYQEIKGKKLYPKFGQTKGLVHVIMKAAGQGGITERDLTLVFVGIESVCALAALALYYKF
jgi:UDP-N-acetylglucosamine--dolichyl-phosphate N-acetylglucosaminephosphotransferase